MNEPRLSPQSSTESSSQRDRKISRALGLFLAAMALLLLVALPFATLTIDRVLELVAASILALVAAIFFRASRSR